MGESEDCLVQKKQDINWEELPKALWRYKKHSFSIQLKARFFYKLSYALAGSLICLISYTIYLQLTNPVYGKLYFPVLLPEIGILLIVFISLYLLVKGSFRISAHILIITTNVAAWVGIWMDRGDAISSLDSVVFILAIVTIFPLLIKRKITIILYIALNLSILFIFMIFNKERINLPVSTMIDYLADTSIAFIFSGMIAYNIYKIHHKVLVNAIADLNERHQAEKALMESEKKYSDIADLLPQTIFEADISGKLNYINRTGLETFQLETIDISNGVNIFSHIHPKEKEKASSNFNFTINDLTVESNKYTLLRKDGSTLTGQIYSRSFQTRNQVKGIRGIIVDITQQVNSERAIRESELKYRLLMESLNEVVMMVDDQDIIQYVNKKFTEKLGYQSEEMIGKNGLMLLFDEKDKETVINAGIKRKDYIVNQYEVAFASKTGQKIHFLVSAAPIIDSNGKETGFILAMADITDRRQIELELKASQLQFMTLAEMSPVGIFRTRSDGYTSYVNPKWTELSGLSFEEALGDGWLNSVHPEDKNKVSKNWQSRLRNAKNSLAEYRFLKPDGTINWVLGNAVSEIIDGEHKGYIGTITDITEIKNTQRKLENSEKRFREMADLLPQTVWESDLEGKLTFINKHGLQLYGFTFDDFSAGLDFFQNIIEDDRERAKINIKKKLYGGLINLKDEEYTSIKKNGTTFPIKVYVSVISENLKPLGLRGITFDITDIKKAEKELKESEARYRTIIEAFPDLLIISDLEGKITFMNEVARQILGPKQTGLAIANQFLSIHPDDIQMVKSEINKLISQDKNHTDIIEYRFLDLNKQTRWSNGIISKIMMNGQIFLQTISRDITEKKAIEQELSNYRSHLEFLVSKRTEELASLNEELTMNNEELFAQRESLEIALENLKRTQEQLVHSEKMASLGVLAAGVAHEINNPLNFINGGILGIEAYLDEQFPEYTKDLTPLLNSIHEGVHRATSIVTSLNQYSRKEDEDFSECNINSIINNCLVILNNQLKNRIVVHKEYAQSSYKFTGNEGKLHQAFLNILTNANQAISEKGIIKISTKIEKNFLTITIADSGCGISNENLKKILDPFFTTKEPGKGVGLGLSICYNIIHAHKGNLKIDSVEGKGTVVTIVLPIDRY
jgi:PAS domain S-box-containing protein